MKKNILLLVLAIMLYEPSFGQVTKESYEKAVDILNYQSVYYSLSVLSPTKGVTAKFSTSCNCESSPSFERIKSSIPATEPKTTKISSEIENLKNQDISEFDKSAVLDFMLTEAFSTSQSLNEFKTQLEQEGKYSDYKIKLAQRLEGVLQENIQANTSSQNASESKLSALENRIQIIEQNQDVNEESPGIFGGFSDYFVILAIVLGLLSLFLALRKRDNYEELLHRILDSKRLREFVQTNNSFNRNTQSNNSNIFEIRDLHNRIGDLDFQISKLKEQLLQLTESSQNSPTHQAYQEVKRPESKTEILFLSTPNSDGSFNESSASNTYKDGASIYRLMKTSNVNAKFQIDEKEASIKFALTYPDKCIIPVCDSVNEYEPKYTKIKTLSQGESDLQDGKWVLKSKAVIRYED